MFAYQLRFPELLETLKDPESKKTNQ